VFIRPAELRDVPTIADLIMALAVYEKEPESAQATHDQLRDALFAENPQVFCDLVETDEGVVAGFAVWFVNYSTWTGRHGIYLEDLFVLPAYRGRGYGKALLVHLARICVARNYGRFQWSVLDWNQPSIDFYRSLGAESLDEWTTYRVTGDALAALAATPLLPAP